MSAPLVFLDTETTGVHPGRRPWEIAMIRRDEVGERELTLLIHDVDLSLADPFGLKVGGFYERHPRFEGKWRAEEGKSRVVEEVEAASYVEQWTRGAHIVGAVPNFDTETLAEMLRRHRLIPGWHYHLCCVENLAVGWLSALRAMAAIKGLPPPAAVDAARLPWDSDELSLSCGVAPAGEGERHTAMGDARWAMRLYDAVTSGTPGAPR